MPPKAVVAQGSMVDAKFKADQENTLARFGEFLAAQRPPLSVAEYSALIPEYAGGPHWTAHEEDQLQAEGRYACILEQGQEIWEKNRGARFLWRLFPMVYRCLPTDLFSWAYQIDVDTSKNVDVQSIQYGRQRNKVWAMHFCHALVSFTMHGFWAYNREWDFPIMAQLMQLAVICRTNDCRSWNVVNHTEDTFFTELATEIQKQGVGVRTIKAVMDAVEKRMNEKKLRPSQFRLICQEIVRACFKPAAGPLVNGTPGPYKVTVDDLTALVGVMNRLGPSTERTGMPIGWSAETWKIIMDKSWVHDNRQEPQPNRANGALLARAVMFGLIQRERDEKIAERAAQAQAQAQAQTTVLPNDVEDTMMADDDLSGGAYDDYGANNFESEDDEPTQLDLSPQALAKKKYVDDVLAQVEAAKAFDRQHPPTLRRDQGPRPWLKE